MSDIKDNKEEKGTASNFVRESGPQEVLDPAKIAVIDESMKPGPAPKELEQKEFRGLTIALDQKTGSYALKTTPEVSVLEIYGVLKLLLHKMEKELGVS